MILLAELRGPRHIALDLCGTLGDDLDRLTQLGAPGTRGA